MTAPTRDILNKIEGIFRDAAFHNAGVARGKALPPVYRTSKQFDIQTVSGERFKTSLYMSPKLIVHNKRRIVLVGYGYAEQFFAKLFSQMESI